MKLRNGKTVLSVARSTDPTASAASATSHAIDAVESICRPVALHLPDIYSNNCSGFFVYFRNRLNEMDSPKSHGNKKYRPLTNLFAALSKIDIERLVNSSTPSRAAGIINLLAVAYIKTFQLTEQFVTSIIGSKSRTGYDSSRIDAMTSLYRARIHLGKGIRHLRDTRHSSIAAALFDSRRGGLHVATLSSLDYLYDTHDTAPPLYLNDIIGDTRPASEIIAISFGNDDAIESYMRSSMDWPRLEGDRPDQFHQRWTRRLGRNRTTR
jgi:hypothetical protein